MERDRNFVYLDTFVWDTAKNEYNRANHEGLSFEMACRVFNDPWLCRDYDYAHSIDEDRDKYIGRIEGLYITSVIATDRGELIRIISARRATPEEIKLYEENAKRIQGY